MPNRSLWLTDEEERRVREIAEHNGCSFNFTVRLAIRSLVGLPAPPLELLPGSEDRDQVADRS